VLIIARSALGTDDLQDGAVDEIEGAVDVADGDVEEAAHEPVPGGMAATFASSL